MPKIRPAALPAGSRVGDYRVVRELAAGGFSIVYLAVDGAGHEVAIKEYMPASLVSRRPGQRAPEVLPDKLPLYRHGLRSFFDEGRALAQISHPAIISVLDFFRENETVYMVMDYLRGATLMDFIVVAREAAQGRPKIFREGTIRSLFEEILRGLQVLHQRKIVHLDLKPANIFITNDNRALVLDFGAARVTLNSSNDFIRPMFTPGFSAPEAYRRGAILGPWNDLYGIGACMYSCMKGTPPPSARERRKKDRLESLLARLRGHYSDNLIEIVLWCMAMDPLARPSSVFALQKELNQVQKRRYSRLSLGERLQLGLGNVFSGRRRSDTEQPLE